MTPLHHGPATYTRPSVGPADHLPVPRRSSDAVGSCRTGPMPQVQSPVWVGLKKSDDCRSPEPKTSGGPGAYVTGRVDLVMRTQSELSGTGMTAWAFMLPPVASFGPMRNAESNSREALMESANGFFCTRDTSCRVVSWARTVPG